VLTGRTNSVLDMALSPLQLMLKTSILGLKPRDGLTRTVELPPNLIVVRQRGVQLLPQSIAFLYSSLNERLRLLKRIGHAS
jgi:hypothetical protein